MHRIPTALPLFSRILFSVTALAVAGCSTTRTVDTPAAQAPSQSPAGQKSSAEKLVVTEGLASHQVYQRDASDRATIRCSGTTKQAGRVMAAVISAADGGKAVVPRTQVGVAADGKWLAEIKGVPTGGPYAVLVTIRDSADRTVAGTARENILVGDLWILAGQSNMQGVGDLKDVEAPSPFVHVFASRYAWEVAEEPLHRLPESPNAIHFRVFKPNMTDAEIEKARSTPRPPPTKGSGLGLPFAREIYARTKVPIGLIPCAHGGTSMEHWDPARRDERGNSIYGSMYDRFVAVGGKVKGVLWYQGEADANPKVQGIYHDRFKKFIGTIRKDLGDAELPFYLVQLSRVVLPNFDPKSWNAVQEDERLIATELPNVVTVPAIDLELDDIIHIGCSGHKRLGRRLARVALHHVYGDATIKDGPALKTVTLAEAGVIRVEFAAESVSGSLAPHKHIAGFSLQDAEGKPGPEFYDVEVEAPNVVVCRFAGELPKGARLSYGAGVNPYCNLVDEQDMAAPVFGPIPVSTPSTAPKP